MKFIIEPQIPYWWLWILTLILILAAFVGWTPGYSAVIAVSAIQVIIFAIKERSFTAFTVQIRLVFFAATLLGLLPAVRFPFYILIFIATFMGTFLGRCSISLILKRMPWNRNRVARLY